MKFIDLYIRFPGRQICMMIGQVDTLGLADIYLINDCSLIFVFPLPCSLISETHSPMDGY